MRTLIAMFLGALVGAVLISGTMISGRRAARSPERQRGHPLTVASSPSGATATSPHAPARPSVAQARETFLIAELRDPQTWETLFLAEGGAVRAISLPAAVARTVLPVTDGTRIYAYVTGTPLRSPSFPLRPRGYAGQVAGQDREQGTENRDVRIAAFSFDGREEETITDSTPLVEPRGLFSSPNGQAIAFFLDDRKSENTELWVYDTATRTKRVSVEHLSRPTVSGPYFAFDGSFLLRSGDQLLAGSPRRTGVDILPTVFRASAVRWDQGVARSPDGQRIALVEETGDERTTVTHVREYDVRAAGSRIRFSLGRGSVRVLGWTERDELLLLSGSLGRNGSFDRPTLHVLRGDQQVDRVLDGTIAALTLAGNGTAIGLLRTDVGEPTMAVQELSQPTSRVITTIPRNDALLQSRAGDSSVSREFRLVQMLRSGTVATATDSSSAPIAPSGILSYVMANIRTLANAPPREPATPERVWKLATPNAFYVDYRIGSTLWRRLIQVQVQNGAVVGATVTGIYAPVGGEWVLAKGEGVSDPTPVQLFEYEADAQQWFEKPVAQYAVP